MKLSVVCSPIGNLQDLSDRATAALRDADVWYVEDTRVSGKLAAHLGIKKPMRVLNDHTHSSGLSRYLDELEGVGHAALLTDGGAPGISDPGALLVDGAYDRGVHVEAIPGPSAVVTALSVSGFFAQRFAFLGFPGRKAGDVRDLFGPFSESPMTLVYFDSPHRFRATLGWLGEVLGERRYAIARELTKLHEQVYRDRLPAVPDEAQVIGKGEFTLVIEGVRKVRELRAD
ncbi:MAG: 16S rRNA (cytidine(1402)-2'-O)-methyltransferase [Fimbriimonadaceae bacterium]|nr:16S rRNA (cytidine(1402)-2'-O)-methyltransferase [Fimbriimonadaceae bacterium]